MLRLPLEKLERLQALIREWAGKKSCTRRDLERFLGHLCHAASVVRPGRAFLRELFALLKRVKQPHQVTRLSAGARADILWWKCLLNRWSGYAFFPPSAVDFHIYSDASGGWGCGAFADTLGWFQLQWPVEWHSVDISVKELVPIAIAAAIWGPQWAKKHICFHADNMAVVAVLQRGTAKSPPLAQLLRCIALYSAYYGFHYTAMHIPGVMNEVADALSRNKANHVASFVSQVPQFHLVPQVYRLLISERPDWGSLSWTELFGSSLLRASPPPPGKCTSQASAAS